MVNLHQYNINIFQLAKRPSGGNWSSDEMEGLVKAIEQNQSALYMNFLLDSEVQI